MHRENHFYVLLCAFSVMLCVQIEPLDERRMIPPDFLYEPLDFAGLRGATQRIAEIALLNAPHVFSTLSS
ncbi:MAG: hypothetical protein GVY30_00550 [Chloroflexi bacterium]|nr:hypothetical protein [Chloroflexota bacterium]